MPPDDVKNALRQLVEESMVETHGRGAATRYRLHDLIRIFGSTKLREAAEAGKGAQRSWQRAMVSHYSRWLKDRDDRGRYKETSESLAAFDAERSNVEAALAQAADDQFPALVVAGRNLLRHRVDHGTRRSLLHKALKILDGALPAPVPSPTAPSPPPSRTPSDEVQTPLLPLLLIELGYVHNNASQYKEGTIAYAAALRHAVGRPVAGALLAEAGLGDVPDLDTLAVSGDGVPLFSGAVVPPPAPEDDGGSAGGGARRRPEPAPARTARAVGGGRRRGRRADAGGGRLVAAVRGRRRRRHRRRGLRGANCEDPRVGRVADAGRLYGADGEVAAEALNLLAENLNCRDLHRGSQLLHPRPPRAAAAAGQGAPGGGGDDQQPRQPAARLGH